MSGVDAAKSRGREPAAGARSASVVRETRFALAPHVFACVEGSHVVLLDLEHDEYYALDTAMTRGLPALVPGWPGAQPGADATASATTSAHAPSADHARQVVESLLRHGLLVERRDGRCLRPPDVCRAQDDLQSVPAHAARLQLRDVARVARATGVAAVLLRCCSLDRIVRRTLARKRRGAASTDPGRLAELVACFERLLPLFLSGRDACLLESLALLEFLAGHGVQADWVFGVRTRPFAAHCWVQAGNVVCNDRIERVCRFTPILVA